MLRKYLALTMTLLLCGNSFAYSPCNGNYDPPPLNADDFQGATKTFVELFNQGLVTSPDFAKAVKLIPDTQYLKFTDGINQLDESKQINRVLIFLRRFNFKLGNLPAVRQQLEAIQKDFLSLYIETYAEQGDKSLQESFTVPVGGKFFLAWQGDKSELFIASVNKVNTQIFSDSPTPTLYKNQDGHSVALQTGTPIKVNDYQLLPVTLLYEDFLDE